MTSYVIGTHGGPNEGTRSVDETLPLPYLLLAEGGSYIRQAEGPMGASYDWQPGDPAARQLTEAIAVAIKTRRFDEVPGLLAKLALQEPGQAEAIQLAILVARSNAHA